MRATRLFSVLSVVGVVSMMVASGCSEDTGSGGSDDDDCEISADCSDGSVCVTQAGATACAVTCSASVDECGGEASCDGVGALSVNICQETPDPMDPPKPEEEPRIPCESDAECAALQPGAICAQFKNSKDCTIPCSAESDCDVPAVGGITVDFLACLTDEADTSRMACVPDEACFNDPLSCISAPGL